MNNNNKNENLKYKNQRKKYEKNIFLIIIVFNKIRNYYH